MTKVVKGTLDVQFEEEGLVVCDGGQGYHVLRSKKALNGLTARDCTELSGERWPAVGQTAHASANIHFLDNFQQQDRSNLGCHCDVSGLWDQASNAEEEVRVKQAL